MLGSAHIHIWTPYHSEPAFSFLELAKSKLFNNKTQGHAALELLLPINEYSKMLIQQYIQGTSIDFSIVEKENKYRIYWSFGYAMGNYQNDRLIHGMSKAVQWEPRFEKYIEPGIESIEPNLIKLIETVPFLSKIDNYLYLKTMIRTVGLENFPPAYEKKLAPYGIYHETYHKAHQQTSEKIDEQDFQSLGVPADHLHVLPVSQNESQESGLSVERMLKKMKQYDEEKVRFDLYGVNCSETVLNILAAGDRGENSLFSERSFVFKLANPFLVHSLCEKYEEKSKLKRALPLAKKVKIEHDSEDENYKIIDSNCPVEALSQCSLALLQDKKIPYLNSESLRTLQDFLADEQSDFGCVVSTEKGEEILPLSEAWQKVSSSAFQRANEVFSDQKSFKRKRDIH